MASSGKGQRDDLEITAIGALYRGPLEKKYWSSSRGKEKYPYPVGYQATRWHSGHSYFMEVTEGSRGPIFAVTCEEGIACSGQTPFAPWEDILKKRHAGVRKVIPRNSSAALDGPEMFGFTHPLVQRLCRDLVVSANGVAETSAGEGSTRGKEKNVPNSRQASVKHSRLAASNDKSQRMSTRWSKAPISNDEKRVNHSSNRHAVKMKLRDAGNTKIDVQGSSNQASRRLSGGSGSKMKGLEGIFSNLTEKRKPEVRLGPSGRLLEDKGLFRSGVPAKRRRSSRSQASVIEGGMPLMREVQIAPSESLQAKGPVTRRKRHLIGKDSISNETSRTTGSPFGIQHTAKVVVDVVEDSESPRSEKHDVPDSLVEESELKRAKTEDRTNAEIHASASVLNAPDEPGLNRPNGKKRVMLTKADRGPLVRPAKMKKQSPVSAALPEEPKTLPLTALGNKTGTPAAVPDGTATASPAPPSTDFGESLDSQEHKYENNVDLTQSQGVLSIDLMCPSIEDISPNAEPTKLSPGKSGSASQQDGVSLLLEAVNLTKMTKNGGAVLDEKQTISRLDNEAVGEAVIPINDEQEERKTDRDGAEGSPVQATSDKCGVLTSPSAKIGDEGSHGRSLTEGFGEEVTENPQNISSEKDSTLQMDSLPDRSLCAKNLPESSKLIQQSPQSQSTELPASGGGANEDAEEIRIRVLNPSSIAADEVNSVQPSAANTSINDKDAVKLILSETSVDVQQEPSSSGAIKSTRDLSDSNENVETKKEGVVALVVIEDVPDSLSTGMCSAQTAQATPGAEGQENYCLQCTSRGSQENDSAAVDAFLSGMPPSAVGGNGEGSKPADSIEPSPVENKATNVPSSPFCVCEENLGSKVPPGSSGDMAGVVPALPVESRGDCYANNTKAIVDAISGKVVFSVADPAHDTVNNTRGESKGLSPNTEAKDPSKQLAGGLKFAERQDEKAEGDLVSKPASEKVVFRHLSSSLEYELVPQLDHSPPKRGPFSVYEGGITADIPHEENAKPPREATVSLENSQSLHLSSAAVAVNENAVTFGQVLEDGVVTVLSLGSRVDLLADTLQDDLNEMASHEKLCKDAPVQSHLMSQVPPSNSEIKKGIAGRFMENGVVTVLPPDYEVSMEDTVPDVVCSEFFQATDSVKDNGHVVTTAADAIVSAAGSQSWIMAGLRSQTPNGTSCPALVVPLGGSESGLHVTCEKHLQHGLTTLQDPLQEVPRNDKSHSLENSTVQVALDGNVRKCSKSKLNDLLHLNLISRDRTVDKLDDKSQSGPANFSFQKAESMDKRRIIGEAKSDLENKDEDLVETSVADAASLALVAGKECREGENPSSEKLEGDQDGNLISADDIEPRSEDLRVHLDNANFPENSAITTSNTIADRSESNGVDHRRTFGSLKNWKPSSESAIIDLAVESKSIRENLQSEQFEGSHPLHLSDQVCEDSKNLVGESSRGAPVDSLGRPSESQVLEGVQDSEAGVEMDVAPWDGKASATSDNPVNESSVQEQKRSPSTESSPLAGNVIATGKPVMEGATDDVTNDKRTPADGQDRCPRAQVSLDDLTTSGQDDYADIMNDGLENLNSFESDLDLDGHEHMTNSKASERNLDVLCSLPTDFELPVSSQVHSESSEPESLGAQVTKSMLKILLPEALPLLSKNSKPLKVSSSPGEVQTSKPMSVSRFEGEGAANDLRCEVSQAVRIHNIELPAGPTTDYPSFLDAAQADDQILFAENDIAERYFPAQEMAMMQVDSDVSLTELAGDSFAESIGKSFRPVQFDAALSHCTMMSARDGMKGHSSIGCPRLQIDQGDGRIEISHSDGLVRKDGSVPGEVAVEILGQDGLLGEVPSKAKLDLPFFRDDPDIDMLVNIEADGQKNSYSSKIFVHDFGSTGEPLVAVDGEEDIGLISAEKTLDYEGQVSTGKRLHEHSKTMDPLCCIEHKCPITAVTASAQGEKVRICVVSGIQELKERTIFVYEVSSARSEAINSEMLCAVASTREEERYGNHPTEVAMEESAVRFSPDGQRLLLLDCFKFSSSCYSHHNDEDGNGVNIVSFDRGRFQVNQLLKCDTSMQCLAVPGPRLVIAGGDDGCICCWKMDADWRNCAESYSLPGTRRGNASSSSVSGLCVMPGQPHLVLGFDYNGYFTLWDANRRTVLSTWHLPSHHVLKTCWLETESFGRSQLENLEQCLADSRFEDIAWREFFLGSFPCLISMVCNQNDSVSDHNASGSSTHDHKARQNGTEWSCKTLILRKDGLLSGPELPKRTSAMTSLGPYGALGTAEGVVQLWDIKHGLMFCELNELEGSPIIKLASNPSSEVLVAANARGQVILYVEKENRPLSSRT